MKRQKAGVNLTVYSFVVNELPEPAAVRQQLERILTSDGFRDAGRIGPLLAFLVDRTLAGEIASLKESVLGVEVFQRPADYDPRTDPIVRVEARRLRSRLEEYYQANPGEPVRILLPKGGYVPVFELQQPGAPAVRPEPPQPPPQQQQPAARFHMSGPALVFIMVTVMSLGIGVFLYLGSRARKESKPAIAVLPFRNLSSDPDNQYFTDGLTIELIEALTRIESLRVVSWNSAARFRGKAESLGELRGQLNAAAVLDGAVRKQGNTIRVTAQLVDTTRGNTLWSQTWDRESKDAFRIQEELAKSIVYALRVQMSAEPDQVLNRVGSTSSEAYEDYLRARYHRNSFSRESMALSGDYARKAMERDPAFAPPYALLASNIVLLSYYREMPAQEAAAQAKQLAMKAIALDPRSAEGHAALGTALAMGEWKFAEARTHLLKAVELNPGSAVAHLAYSLNYLLPMARLLEAEAEIKRALQLDPLDFWSNMVTGYILQQMPGREAEALPYYDKAAEIFPKFNDLHWDRGMALAFAGRKDEALAAFRHCANLRGDRDWQPGPVEMALLGEKDKVAEAVARDPRLDPIQAARALAMAGLVDQALQKLNQAYAESDRQMMFMKVDRRLAKLHGRPEFEALVRKIGLSE